MPPPTLTSTPAPATLSRLTAIVDLLVGAGDELFIQWVEAPGHVRRAVAATQVRQLLACMKEVHDAEEMRNSPRIRAAALAASRGLADLLDGPERALFRRIDEAEQQGVPLLIVVRALADCHDTLRAHLATRLFWQLLPLADMQEHGRGRFSAVLQLGPRNPGLPQALPHDGLRILFMAFSPQDVQPVLDYEGEEERFLEMLAPFISKGRAQLRIVEDGTLEDLERALLLDAYDVVHLTGHGIITPQGPRLLMEDDTGMRRRRTDGTLVDVSPADLIATLRRAVPMPPLVVLSNCHSADSRDATPSFAVELVAAGVPVTLGWTRPVRDDHATDAAGDIYQQLAAGKPLVEAVELARDLLRQREEKSPQPSRTWSTLALVASSAAGVRVDRHAPPLPPMLHAEQIYRFLLGGHMKVLERGFVGRRRLLQRLVRVLRDGKFADEDGGHRYIAGVVVWGMKGIGKSCLVARAVERAAQHSTDLGLVVLHGALHDMAVLTAFQRLAVDRWGDTEAEKLLAQKDLPVSQRVRRVLALWSTRPVAVIFDDFEQNLDLRTDGPARLHSHAAELLDVLVPACKIGDPKLLITTTVIFELPASFCTALGELRVGALEPSSVRKLWMRGPSATGHIPVSLGQWEILATRLGRNARILSWARELLASKTSDELTKAAARVAEQVPVWEPGDEIREEKHSELAQLFLRHMAHEEARAAVGPDALEFLRRARVYEVAVPAEAFEPLTEGLSIVLERDLVALANRGLLEVGELDGQRAYRISPLVEPTFTAERPERWHGVASRFWWDVMDTGKAVSEQLERVQHSWRHAVSGRHPELAARAGRVIDLALFRAGLYYENRQRAEEHLTALPDAPFAAQWAGEAECHAMGPTPRARALLQTALQGLVEAHGTDRHPEVAACLHALGGVLHALGDLPAARAALERSLAIRAEVHGTDRHPSFAANLQALGGVLQALGDLPAARAALERSLAIQAEVHGTDRHPNVAAGLHALGGVLHAQGDLPAARTALERSLAIQAEVHGNDKHPQVAVTLHCLGGVLHAEGDLPAARAAIERSLAIKAEVHGARHPEAAVSLYALGEVLHAQGDLPAARAALERSLTIQSEVYDNDRYPEVAASLYALARVLRAQDDLPGAREALERSLAIQAEVYGTDRHPEVAVSLQALGDVLHALGELPAARAAIERSLAIQAEVYGTDRHLNVAASLHALGGVLHALGELPAARAAIERSFAIQAEVHGNDRHPEAAASLHAQGGILHALGELPAARAAIERSLAIQAEVHRTDRHPNVAASLHVLGGILHAQGDLRGARAALEHSLAIKAEVYGTDRHPSIAVSLHSLAMVYLAENKPYDAAVLFRRALDIEK